MNWLKYAALASLVIVPSIVGATPGFAQDSGKTICFLYNDRSVEYWTDAAPMVFKEFRDKGVNVAEKIYNNDTNKQLEQTRDCITQKVDGIGIFPQDAESAVTIIQEANAAGIPIGIFNRPPANTDHPAILTSADNYKLTADAMEYLTTKAKDEMAKLGHKITPLILVGDLGDQTAVLRRKAFMDVVAKYPDVYNDPIEVPTKWDAATALANLQNALQADPDVDLVFTSSDFLYPQVQAALEPLGKWKKLGEDGRIIVGGVDGEPSACQLMRDGFVDATAVQDMTGELHTVLADVLKAADAGQKTPSESVVDPIFTLTQANLGTDADKMWGCQILDSKKS